MWMTPPITLKTRNPKTQPTTRINTNIQSILFILLNLDYLIQGRKTFLIESYKILLFNYIFNSYDKRHTMDDPNNSIETILI